MTLLFVCLLNGLMGTKVSYGQNITRWQFSKFNELQIQEGFTTHSSISQIPSTSNGCSHYLNDSVFYYVYNGQVYNKDHNIVSNGSGLLSDIGSPSLAVPSFDFERWVIFTMEVEFDSSLSFSILDLSPDGFNGSIDSNTKNTLISENSNEYLSGFLGKEQNARYGFVVYRDIVVDSLMVLSVDRVTLEVKPWSRIHLGQFDEFFGHMRMRFSELGGKFAVVQAKAIGEEDSILIGDYSAKTGLLSNLFKIGFNDMSGLQELEFSGSGQYLYFNNATNSPGFYRVDLEAGSPGQIEASLDTVVSSLLGCFQLTPFREIFHSIILDSCIGALYNPEESNISLLDYDSCSVFLNGNISSFFFPRYMAGTLINRIVYSDKCDSTFAFDLWGTKDSVHWSFGDASSGLANNAVAFQTAHQFSDTGWYTIKAIIYDGIYIDSIYSMVHVNAGLNSKMAFDSTILFCQGTDVSLMAVNHPYSKFTYAWSNGAVSSGISTSEAGEYILSISDRCDTVVQRFTLIEQDTIYPSLPNDTSICSFDSITLIVHGESPFEVLWNTGDTSSALNISRAGNWTVSVKNACGIFSDSIHIAIQPSADGRLPEDSIYCAEGPVILTRQNTDGITYIWSNGSSEEQIRVDSSGYVSLISYGACDSLNSESLIEIVGIIKPDLGAFSSVCSGEQVELFNHARINPNYSQDMTYHWSTGEETESIWVSDSGRYWLNLQYGTCSVRDTVQVDFRGDCYDHCKPAPPNIITPNADGVNDVFKLEMLCEMTDIEVNVYNRWGQLLASKKGEEFKNQYSQSRFVFNWDGRVEGFLVAEGVYFYHISYKPKEASNFKSYRGSFHVIY